MEFAWEEVLIAICELPENIRYEAMDAFLHQWIKLVSCKMYEEDIGIKKILDSEITQNEIEYIFDNSGYVICSKCRKVVEDDHTCLG
jgi:hypothetical protein